MERPYLNLNEFSWHLNVALIGGVFAVFSLIYKDHYIYYGLITFAFGVSGHIVFKIFESMFRKDGENSKYYWVRHLFNVILAVAWIMTIIRIY